MSDQNGIPGTTGASGRAAGERSDGAGGDLVARARAAALDMISRDRAAHALGLDLSDAGPGYATITMPVTEEMLNGADVLHGGITFLLADTAMGMASNSHGVTTVTRSSDIEYLRPARAGDRLRAIATERRRSSRGGVYDVRVLNQDDALIADFRGHSAVFARGPASTAAVEQRVDGSAG